MSFFIIHLLCGSVGCMEDNAQGYERHLSAIQTQYHLIDNEYSALQQKYSALQQNKQQIEERNHQLQAELHKVKADNVSMKEELQEKQEKIDQRLEDAKKIASCLENIKQNFSQLSCQYGHMKPTKDGEISAYGMNIRTIADVKKLHAQYFLPYEDEDGNSILINEINFNISQLETITYQSQLENEDNSMETLTKSAIKDASGKFRDNDDEETKQ